jgi:predicted RNA-binding protein associated with RNAse of E/G family
MQIRLHYTRLSSIGAFTFVENLLAEDDYRLTTCAVVDEADREALSAKFWSAGLLPNSVRVASLRKHYFFSEWFDILAWFDEAGCFAGYYTDIATPVRKVGDGQYAITDLFLDFWQAPGQPALELDLDEFDEAFAAGTLTPELAAGARASFARVRREIALGIFPYRYVRA